MTTIESYLTHLYTEPPSGLPRHSSFREYMETCLFHPEVGYYSSGRVSIGIEQDFWTYPVRLSPLFGELLSLRILELWRALRHRLEAERRRFTAVEVGGGHGELLRDVMQALRRRARTDEEAAALLDRFDAIAVDKSPALLVDQATSQSDYEVTHMRAGADELASVLPQPFFGLIFANELLDAMSVEIVRVGQPSVHSAMRLRILPWCDATLSQLTAGTPCNLSIPELPPGFEPLRPGALPELIRTLGSDRALLSRFAGGEIVRWTGVLERFERNSGDPTLNYLNEMRPGLERLRRLDALPAWVLFAPEVARVLDAVASVLHSGAGAFLTIDYGGTAYHVLDQASEYPHLRTFNVMLDGDSKDPWATGDREAVHNPFRAPGCEDLTFDLDFTWIADHLRKAGLELALYSHQGALAGDIDLWKKPYQDQLVAGRLREGFKGVEAVIRSHDLLKRFRQGGGFQLLAMISPGLGNPYRALGSSDPLLFEELESISDPDDLPALRSDIAERLQGNGVEASRAGSIADRCMAVMHPTGSIVDDLGDMGLYSWRFVVLEALGWRPRKEENRRP